MGVQWKALGIGLCISTAVWGADEERVGSSDEVVVALDVIVQSDVGSWDGHLAAIEGALEQTRVAHEANLDAWKEAFETWESEVQAWEDARAVALETAAMASELGEDGSAVEETPSSAPGDDVGADGVAPAPTDGAEEVSDALGDQPLAPEVPVDPFSSHSREAFVTSREAFVAAGEFITAGDDAEGSRQLARMRWLLRPVMEDLMVMEWPEDLVESVWVRRAAVHEQVDALAGLMTHRGTPLQRDAWRAARSSMMRAEASTEPKVAWRWVVDAQTEVDDWMSETARQ